MNGLSGLNKSPQGVVVGLVQLQLPVVETVQHVQMYVASVRFVGQIQDDGETVAVAFEEVWNLQKPITGSSGWTLAGIQQVDVV